MPSDQEHYTTSVRGMSSKTTKSADQVFIILHELVEYLNPQDNSFLKKIVNDESPGGMRLREVIEKCLLKKFPIGKDGAFNLTIIPWNKKVKKNENIFSVTSVWDIPHNNKELLAIDVRKIKNTNNPLPEILDILQERFKNKILEIKDIEFMEKPFEDMVQSEEDGEGKETKELIPEGEEITQV